MKNHQKRAGQSTHDMAGKRYKARIRFVLLMAGITLFILVVIFYSNALGISGLGVLGLLILALFIIDYTKGKARRMQKEARRASRGAHAEEKIGLVLDNLGEGYLVIHDIKSPYGNIDHIVVSKQSGVFLIETKAHWGRVTVANGRLLVNGHEPEKDFISQAIRNTYWLRDEIHKAINVEIWIVPVVVFTNAFVERTAPVKGVTIINKKYLSNVLQKPNIKVRNLLIWENREKLLEIL